MFFLCGEFFVFVLVCDFDINLCEKTWRGLRYGNFHVGGINLGTFVCRINAIIIYGKYLFACDLIGAFVWCKLLVVIRVHGICLNELCARKRSSRGAVLAFSSVGECVFGNRYVAMWKFLI